MLELSDYDFHRLVDYVSKAFGIDLSKKKHLIIGRLSQTVLEMNYKNFEEYINYILSHPRDHSVELMINKLTTNYTYFMRENVHFDFFKRVVLPQLEQTKTDGTLSIWSAGCSSGEEPYTLSMILKDYFRNHPRKWDTRVLATDISQKVLTLAQQGIYKEDSLSNLPPVWKERYFKKLPNQTDYTVTPEIKSNVIFRTFNLMDPINFRLKFDVIFCRNVMIYFDRETKDQLINRFYEATNPGGYLFIGHSESLQKGTHPYQYLMPAIYRKL